MIKRIVVELDEEFHQRIKRKAVNQRKSMRRIVLELLIDWLKK